MLERRVLQDWVMEALRRLGGRATVLEVGRDIWEHRERDLRNGGDLLYTWQYDYRWAATALRRAGKIVAAEQSPIGVWELTDAGRRN